ncbi:MAG: zinc ribbon domain-containing protein [Anaerolineales bacterium]|nr:zinc ribbon domain-containing protein [Anaerolineales bacterium]
MPLYSFSCPDCLIEVEELRSISQADAPLACPVCQGECQRGLSLAALSSAAQSADTPSAKTVRRHPAACRCC